MRCVKRIYSSGQLVHFAIIYEIIMINNAFILSSFVNEQYMKIYCHYFRRVRLYYSFNEERKHFAVIFKGRFIFTFFCHKNFLLSSFLVTKTLNIYLSTYVSYFLTKILTIWLKCVLLNLCKYNHFSTSPSLLTLMQIFLNFLSYWTSLLSDQHYIMIALKANLLIIEL